MTDERIAEIGERCEAATAGPWGDYISDYDAGTMFVAQMRDGFINMQLDPVADQIWSEADAAFIAHAREDVQRLLADRAELVAEVERLRAAGRDVLDMLPYHGLLDLPELRAALEDTDVE